MAQWKKVCLAYIRPWVQTSEWDSTKKRKSRHITVKLLKSKDKEKIFKAARENDPSRRIEQC